MLYCSKPLKIYYIEDDKKFAETLCYVMQVSYGLNIEHIGIRNITQFISRVTDEEITNWRVNNQYLHNMLNDRSIPLNTLLDFYRKSIPAQSAVIIFDHDLGNKSGLRLCQSIKSRYVGKIMFTGKADQSEIIAAFNDGIIDLYVSKNEREIFDYLARDINQVQNKIFFQLFGDFDDLLFATISDEKTRCGLQEFIVKIINTKHITEHYLIDAIGSRYLIDSADNRYYLLIYDDNSIEAQNDVLVELGVSKVILNEIIERKKLLYIERDFNRTKWFDHLHDCKRIPGVKGYYYSWVKKS